MNAAVQSQLDRIEAALTTLTDSVASYNPSVAAVHELLAADDALTEGLNQLTTHQLNHRRILTLHSTSTHLTTALTTTLTTLSSLRASILSAPATRTTPSHRPIPASALLDYAKTISTYGAPPGLREKLSAAKQEALSASTSTDPSTQLSTQPDSTQQTATESTARQPDPPLPLPNGTATTPFHPTPDNPTAPLPTGGIAISSLTTPEIHWLNPLLQTPYLAWPSEEKIRQGALASLQARWDSGEDVEADAVSDGRLRGPGDGGMGVKGEGAGEGIDGEGDGEGGRSGKEMGDDGTNGMEGVVRGDERDVNGGSGRGRRLENGEGGAGRGREREREREAKPSVFQGLDMYDVEDE